MGLFAWIGQGFQWLFKLVAFPFAKLGSQRVRPVLRWSLHLLCVAAIIACLTWLNATLDLDKVVRAPSYALRILWLPLMFLLVYTLAWLAWWVWKVATSPAEASRFPDLDDAWQECQAALDAARIDLAQTPLYLLVGQGQGQVHGFFQAAGLAWEVPPTPRRSAAPLRMCATREAIFLDIAGASSLSAYVSRLLDAPCPQPAGNASSATGSRELASQEREAGGGGTATLAATKRTAQRGLELIEQSLALIETERQSQADVEVHLDGVRMDEAELEEARARLAHVCGLLTESRAPYCPANAVVTIIPWEVTGTQGTTNRAAVLLDQDLETLGQHLRIDAPRIAIISDVQSALGGAELIRRIPEDQRQRRFGVRLPRLSACDSGQWPSVVEQGVTWLCNSLLPALVYRVLKFAEAECEDRAAWQGNSSVYRFLAGVRARQGRILRLLQRGVMPTMSPRTAFGGVYFAATESDVPQHQAFLAGIMPQLLEMQNDVAWNSAALKSDRRCLRWTGLGYTALACFLGGVATIVLAWGR